MIRGCSKCSEDLGKLWTWPKEESKNKRLSKLAINNCYSSFKKKKAKKVAQDIISWAVSGPASLRIWLNFPDFFPVTALGPSSWSPLSSQCFQSVFVSLPSSSSKDSSFVTWFGIQTYLIQNRVFPVLIPSEDPLVLGGQECHSLAPNYLAFWINLERLELLNKIIQIFTETVFLLFLTLHSQ